MDYTQHNPVPIPEGGPYQNVQSTIKTVFDWQYALEEKQLMSLYEKGKALNWNATELDWSTDVDVEKMASEGNDEFFNDVLKAPERLDHKMATAYRVHSNAYLLSQFLHGEQGALVATARIVEQLEGTHRLYIHGRVNPNQGGDLEGMDELFAQTRAVFVADPIEARKFTKRIAFNCIPHIDDFMEDGSTKEEWKMTVETKKILDPSIKLFATCARVPVFVGHCVAAHLELEDELEADEARDLLREAPGLMVIDRADEDDAVFVTPTESVGEFATFVSRIRNDPTVENGLAMWIVSDNLRKGAALNTVQIAEVLVNKGVVTG